MATKTIPFDFQCNNPELAARIASLVSGDIEKLERESFGTSRAITSFPKPLKANYAMDLANRATDDGSAMARLVGMLPTLEQHAQEYISKREGQRGHPFAQYVHAASNQTPTNGDKSMATQTSTQDVQAIISDTIPVPRSSAPAAPQVQPAAPKQTNTTATQDVPVLDNAQAAALKALLDTLAPKPVQATIDPDQLRALVQDEVAKAGRPRPIEVMIRKPDQPAPISAGAQHKMFPRLINAVQSGYPVWIPGPAGSGKTTAVRNVCKALDIALVMPPEGPVDNKYAMIGYMDATGKFVETSLYKACKQANENPNQKVMYFVDECDSAYPNALLVMNAVMENGYCTFANGETVHYGDNLLFAAGANTWGDGATSSYVGRNRIDAATLDRFIMLAWEYDEALESAIAGDTKWTRFVQNARKAATQAGVEHVISPRASLRGNKLLALGEKWADVEASVLWKGLSPENVRSVKGRMTVRGE